MNCGTMFEKPSKPISSTARRRNLSDFTSYVTNCSGADETIRCIPFCIDRNIYEYCDLVDEEIAEREARLAAERAADAGKERKRMVRARAGGFRWIGGMG
jgi:hypothetical protein